MPSDAHIHERILESLADGVMTIDMNGNVRTFNRAAEDILGIKRQDVLARSFGAVFLDEPANDAFSQAIIDAVYEQKTMHQNVVPYFTGADNRSLAVTTSYLERPEGASETEAVVAVFSDITETERFKVLALTDALTGSWNRAYLKDTLPKEIKRALRYRVPLSVIMTDIDFFKAVNDTYGHRAGDLVLKAYADRIQDAFREGVDWISRYGGEEFVLVLPETDHKGALVVAEKIRAAVAAMVVQHDGQAIGVTGSFGVITLEVDGDPDAPSARDAAATAPSMHQLVDQADQLLYLAKDGGRNKVLGAKWSSTPDLSNPSTP